MLENLNEFKKLIPQLPNGIFTLGACDVDYRLPNNSKRPPVAAKAEIRKRSRAAGLFTWDKAAYACLATRIPTGEAITEEKLERTENAENFMYSLGFRDFRVRLFDDSARIQIRECDIPLLIENRERILKTLKESYKAVLFDLEVRDE